MKTHYARAGTGLNATCGVSAVSCPTTSIPRDVTCENCLSIMRSTAVARGETHKEVPEPMLRAGQVLKDALARKYEEGETAGYAAGYSTGREDGYVDGHKDGQDAMRDEGLYRAGYQHGFSVGYARGCAAEALEAEELDREMAILRKGEWRKIPR